MTAEIEAAATCISQGMTAECSPPPHQIATLVRDLARAPLQIANGTSIKRTSFNRTGEDLHDFVTFADRTPAFDVLARCVLDPLGSFPRAFDRV